jgi:hypothetical protein
VNVWISKEVLNRGNSRKIYTTDLGRLPNQKFNWCHSVYWYVERALPKDLPKPLGKSVTTISYKDANLNHDMMTGRSVTGILYFCNKALIHWYSKQQATIESATCGSELTAARIACDQILNLRMTLR